MLLNLVFSFKALVLNDVQHENHERIFKVKQCYVFSQLPQKATRVHMFLFLICKDNTMNMLKINLKITKTTINIQTKEIMALNLYQ